MNIEPDIFDYLETTSLEPHDDYTSEITYKDQKIIWNRLKEKDKEIERLNNIINDLLNRQNEALRYIGNHLSLDSRYKHGNGDKELTLVKNILNKHVKELKGSNEPSFEEMVGNFKEVISNEKH